MATTLNKIVYLDGIRGIAAFCVFLHHFCLAFYPSYYSFDINTSNLYGKEILFGRSVFSVFTNGNFCVCVFFVLSGFVLSRKYFQTQKTEVITSGVYRRFLRLYVPVAATIIISFLMIKAGLFFNTPVSELRHSEWWFHEMWVMSDPWERLWKCLKGSTMFEGDSSFDTSLWTISIEYLGSLFVFAFLMLTHQTKHKFLSLFLVFLYAMITNQGMLATFVFGISLNYVESYEMIRNKYLLNGIAVVLLLAGLFLGSFPSNDQIEHTAFAHLGHYLMEFHGWFHAVGAYFLVLAFVISKEFQYLVSLRIFRFLGYISFSLYLLHPLIIGSFSSFLFLKIHEQAGFNYSVIYIFMLTTGLCFVASWLMAKYIDEPGIRLSHYVYRRWFKKELTDSNKE